MNNRKKGNGFLMYKGQKIERFIKLAGNVNVNVNFYNINLCVPLI